MPDDRHTGTEPGAQGAVPRERQIQTQSHRLREKAPQRSVKVSGHRRIGFARLGRHRLRRANLFARRYTTRPKAK